MVWITGHIFVLPVVGLPNIQGHVKVKFLLYHLHDFSIYFFFFILSICVHSCIENALYRCSVVKILI